MLMHAAAQLTCMIPVNRTRQQNRSRCYESVAHRTTPVLLTADSIREMACCCVHVSKCSQNWPRSSLKSTEQRCNRDMCSPIHGKNPARCSHGACGQALQNFGVLSRDGLSTKMEPGMAQPTRPRMLDRRGFVCPRPTWGSK